MTRLPMPARRASALLLAAALAAAPAVPADRPSASLPWRQAGLTPTAAAAHLLDRFAYGARPGEVERVAAMGPEVWLEHQLAADLPEARLAQDLAPLRSLTMTTAETFAAYPPRAVVRRQARDAGLVGKRDRAEVAGDEDDADGGDVERAALRRFAAGRGYRSPREALGELAAAKVWRAVEAENQLREVLTDFWFNHFNVALSKNRARPFVAAFERDAIRPHVLGRFEDLLRATAMHPAMLLYLDNAASIAASGAPTTAARHASGTAKRRSTGLNENYARELLELHTVGVDGGYTQQDVVEVARAFSGWTVMPPAALRPDARSRYERAARRGSGDALEGDFLFRADAHDAGRKTVLGHVLPAGRGREDGDEVLALLAAHPATARQIARQLAVRFVSDTPPRALVERLAQVYRATGGDLVALVRAIAASPEFWAPEVRRQKIKSPLELAASAVRALGAEVDDPLEIARWIARMGERLYSYPAPTGFPDRAAQWVNAGALLERMSFGLQLGTGRIAGVRVDLAGLVKAVEPAASQQETLTHAAALLLPERPTAETVRELAPLLGSPELERRLAAADRPAEPADGAWLDGSHRPGTPARDGGRRRLGRLEETRRDPWRMGARRNPWVVGERREPSRMGEHRDPSRTEQRGDRGGGSSAGAPPTSLAAAVGLILGSPEFQRR